MQCVTCQGEKECHGVKCYDCGGTGYNVPSNQWKYKGCSISFDMKPIADRSHDYDWTHEDYDGPQDNDDLKYYPTLCGTAESLKECYSQIDELMEELESLK